MTRDPQQCAVPPLEKQRVTIADVAAEAAVSSMTVSRVINNTGRVNELTRERVRKAIKKLGYQPNQVARSLSTRRTRAIGLVVPDITNPFFPEIVRGAEDAAWQAGYTVSLANAVEDPSRERAAIRKFEAHRMDGLIVCSARLPDAELAELVENHPVSVLINRRLPSGPSVSLMVDDRHGAMLATRFVLGRGHERVALLAGPDRSASAAMRRHGFHEAMAAAGLTPDDDLILTCEPTEEAGHAALRTLVERGRPFSALIAYNDLMAVGVQQAAAELGLSVPNDVAVVGCDDIRMASLVTPSLTTLRVDTYAIGRLAAETVFALQRGEQRQHTFFTPELIVRASAP